LFAQITGAGHGIGRELALQVAGLGGRLALWDVDAARCEETAREVRAKGGRAVSYTCDISDRTQVLETAVKVRREVRTFFFTYVECISKHTTPLMALVLDSKTRSLHFGAERALCISIIRRYVCVQARPKISPSQK